MAGSTEPGAIGNEPQWLDDAVSGVRARLENRATDSDQDIYVWSDGTITGPPDADPEDDIRVISVFTPGEQTSPVAIRESLLAGLEAVPASRGDRP